MSFEIYPTKRFEKEVKKLAKKHRSLIQDITALVRLLEEKPMEQGILLHEDCYKIRMAIRSKGKGKSGGARVITHVKIVEKMVFLLSIYDKSDQDSITDDDLKTALQNGIQQWEEIQEKNTSKGDSPVDEIE